MKLHKANLLYLAMLAFALIASFTVSLTKNKTKIVQEIISKEHREIYPNLPVLKGENVTFPAFSGQAIIAQDLESGIYLFEKNPDTAHLPASTTKIFTALVVLDNFDLNTVITVPYVRVDGQKMGLVVGEKMTVRDLLYGLLVYSANDAAEVLAESYCGVEGCGREKFIEAMNRKSVNLGLTSTHFANPSGLDSPNHYSTARDLARVSSVAMKDPIFAEIVGTKETTVKSLDGANVHKLVNINQLLGKVDGVLGVKTGWTENARENLVTYIDRGGRPIVITILGSQNRFGETEELINWIYENYTWEEVVYTYKP